MNGMTTDATIWFLDPLTGLSRSTEGSALHCNCKRMQIRSENFARHSCCGSSCILVNHRSYKPIRQSIFRALRAISAVAIRDMSLSSIDSHFPSNLEVGFVKGSDHVKPCQMAIAKKLILRECWEPVKWTLPCRILDSKRIKLCILSAEVEKILYPIDCSFGNKRSYCVNVNRSDRRCWHSTELSNMTIMTSELRSQWNT
jgi:hypothetical protein